MAVGFLVGSRNFIWFFWVSWEDFDLHGYDCIHCVAKSCTTAAYRWLCRDSLSSLGTLWSAVIKAPKLSALGTTIPARLLQEALVMVFKHISQFGSFGKCENTLCLPEPGSTHARGSIGGSCDEQEVSALLCIGSHRSSSEVLSSTKFSLNSWIQSGNSCVFSLCTSFNSSFLLVVFIFCWFMLQVSPKLFIRTSTSIWYWSFYISVIWYWISVSRCWLL